MSPRSIHSPAHRRLTELLRQAREESGLTQQQVAERLGRPQSFVSKYEAGERRLDLVELGEICVVLGVSLSEFARRFELRG